MNKKDLAEDLAYTKNSSFWTIKGDNLTVVGDYLGRLPSFDLINPQDEEVVLDAGCGAGFMTRKIAKTGADTFGCDRNSEMLEKAISEETSSPLGIKYQKCDITALPYQDSFFDKISCIAVLIHDSPEEVRKFLDESARVLKENGEVIISVMHPFLFQDKSPCRNNKASWVQYKPLDEFSSDKSGRFYEDYRNSTGEIFSSVVWHHPEAELIELVRQSGLKIISTHSQFITQEILDATKQSGAVGYPAFLQIIAMK